MSDYLYKVGDKVKIISNSSEMFDRQRFPMKSGCWSVGDSGPTMNNTMREMAGEIVTITATDGYYKIAEDKGQFFWTDTMFEGKANSVNFRSLL